MIWFYAGAAVLYSAVGLVWLRELHGHVRDLHDRVKRLERRDLALEHNREEARKAIETFEAHYGPLDAVEASDAEPLSEETLERLRKAFTEGDR